MERTEQHVLILVQFRQELNRLFEIYEERLLEVDPSVRPSLISQWLEDEAKP